MTIVLVFAILVFAFYIFLVRRLSRDAGRDTMLPAATIDRSIPETDSLTGTVSPPPPGWTALDDQQLTRLLRESSP